MCQSSNPTANVIPGDPKATHCSIASQLHQHFLRLETISDKHARVRPPTARSHWWNAHFCAAHHPLCF